jgi:integrase
MAMKKIGLKDVRALGPGEIVWDGGLSGVAGFHARRQKGTSVSYVITFRTNEGRQRWLTIGRHGAPWTPELARQEAKRILGQVAGGADPSAARHAQRRAVKVAELCDLYIADTESGRLLTRKAVAKKASTITTDKSRIERHIKPLLGIMKVPAVTNEDVDAFLHTVAERSGKGAASRTTGLLGAIFSYAVRRRMRLGNPAHGVTRFADGRRERRLSDAEYAMLGEALAKADGIIWPAAVAATRFLALTGWRSGEALGLRWDEIDLARRTATLGDTKTGRSVRPISQAACDMLRSLSLTGTGQKELVFRATRGDGRMSFSKLWARIAKLGALPLEITPHTLRHSFASLAGDLGFSEPTIAALIGHTGRSITSRYVHSADAVLLAAADAVADRTSQLMRGAVVQLRQAAV